MVLVSCKPNNIIGILQTQLSHRACEARLKRRPAPMHHLFAMADERQHREHGLHEHTVLPLTARTQCEVGGVAFGGMEAGVTQDNHMLLTLPTQPLKRIICYMGGGTRPRHYQPPLVE